MAPSEPLDEQVHERLIVRDAVDLAERWVPHLVSVARKHFIGRRPSARQQDCVVGPATDTQWPQKHRTKVFTFTPGAMTFLLAIFVTSVAGGAVGAILGLGGGMLLVPVLTIFFGVNLHFAMGASIVSVIATSSGAAAAYLRTRMCNIRIGLFLVMATTAGAVTGAYVVGVVPIRWLEFILGLALGYSAFATLQQINVELPENVPYDRLAARFSLEGTYYDALLDRDVKYRAGHVGRGFAAMYGAGVLSGLLGIGSGAFKVLAMDYFMRLPMKVSTATSNFMIGITAAASAGVYLTRGDVHPLLAAPVAIGVLLGANIGMRLMTRMRNAMIRKAFLPILIYLAMSMLLRSLGIKLL